MFVYVCTLLFINSYNYEKVWCCLPGIEKRTSSTALMVVREFDPAIQPIKSGAKKKATLPAVQSKDTTHTDT